MDLFENFKTMQKKQKAYAMVLGIAGWDSNTEAPKKCFPYRAEMLSTISGEYFSLLTSDEYKETLQALYGKRHKLEDTQRKEIEKAMRGLEKIIKIPKAEYIEYSKLITLSQRVWEEAKEKSDYEIFKPYLKKIIAAKKHHIAYRGGEDTPYNMMLDDFEEGMNQEKYDTFFKVIKEELVPFVKKILASKERKRQSFMDSAYDKDDQRTFVKYLAEKFAYDFDRGGVKESVHPFTWNTHSQDVRFTVRYLENQLFSSIFAAIHELGHALYEQQIDEIFDMTNLGSGASMGIHESQSRFYENIIGRSRAFWEKHYDKLRSLFPKQLEDVKVKEFHQAVNHVEESFIRVEADELTYPLHILIRYEIERMIFNENIDLEQLPSIWNQKIKAYLNIDVQNDSEGILQDVHWSAGMFGYFPTYALGSAYAAQILETMQKDIDINQLILTDEIIKINAWLKDKIHCFGAGKKPDEILKDVTGKSFDPAAYVRYLKAKYTKLYLEG